MARIHLNLLLICFNASPVYGASCEFNPLFKSFVYD
jgi:hypothetical protein